MKKRDDFKFPLKGKYVVMVAPSFVVDFSYPEILFKLRALGFDKIVELTFGAKIVNREYHKTLGDSNELKIASVCPGVVDLIQRKYPKYQKNLLKVDSPMIVMAKICKKTYPKHKIVFLSPCNYKKIEAKKSGLIDFVLDYREFKKILVNFKIKSSKNNNLFDKFYNDYTKVYPLTGGLSKTAHLKKIVKKKEIKIIDGVKGVMKFLDNPQKGIKFLDCNFCIGGCIGGPCINSVEKISKRKKKVLKYLKDSLREDIPENKKGLIERAEGISFFRKY